MNTRRAILVLVAVAALVRLGHIFFMQDSPLFLAPTSDAFEHYVVAVTLAEGDWLGRSIGPYHRPQLFAYFSGVVYALFGARFAVLHFFLNALDVAAVVVWYLVARRCFPRVPTFIGALCIAVHWPFVYFASSGYMETFAMFLNGVFLLALAMLARAVLKKPKGLHWHLLIAAAVAGGLCILTRPTVILTMPGIGLAVWWLYRQREGTWARALVPASIFAAMMAAIVGINALRHAAMFGIWAPLGTGSDIAFHMGNRIDGWGWDVSSPGIEYEIYQKLPFVNGVQDPSIENVRAWWKEENTRFVSEETGTFVSHLAIKALRLLNAYEIYCTQDFAYAKQQSPLLRFLPGLLLFMPFVLAGFFFTVMRLIRQKPPTARWWTLLVIVLWLVPYFAGVALYLDISRHRLPMVPAGLLMGGWILWRLFREWKNPALIAAIIGGVIIANLPVIPRAYYAEHERWWTQVNLGVANAALGDLPRAVEHYTAATEIMPEKLEGHRQLALAEWNSGNLEEAVAAQKRLLMLFRQQYPAFYMIEAEIFEHQARMEIDAQRHDDAEKTARKLTGMLPESARAHALLSRALIAGGKREEGIGALERAAALDPRYNEMLSGLRDSQ